jgi:hypothetical protein
MKNKETIHVSFSVAPHTAIARDSVNEGGKKTSNFWMERHDVYCLCSALMEKHDFYSFLSP